MKIINLLHANYQTQQNAVIRRDFDLEQLSKESLYCKLLISTDGYLVIDMYASSDNLNFVVFKQFTVSSFYDTEIIKIPSRFLRFEIAYFSATYVNVDLLLAEKIENLIFEMQRKLNKFLVVDNSLVGHFIETNRGKDYIINSFSSVYMEADEDYKNMFAIYYLSNQNLLTQGNMQEGLSIRLAERAIVLLSGKQSFRLITPNNGLATITLTALYPDKFVSFTTRKGSLLLLNHAEYSIFLISSTDFPCYFETARYNIDDFDFFYSPTEYPKTKIIKPEL